MIDTTTHSIILDEKVKIISKIRESSIFSNAPTSSALLAYLSQSSFENKKLKETIIELEFFGNKTDSSKNNPRVRVNVYNLRKKIGQYYENEGKNDIWRIEIKKGQYSLSFYKEENKTEPIQVPSLEASYTPNTDLKPIEKYTNSKLLIVFGFVTIVLLSTIGYLLIPIKTSNIWASFSNSKTPITLYIGDAYGFMGKTASGNWGWNRDYSINCEEDLKLYMKNPIDSLNSVQTSNYNYMTRMGAYGAQALSLYFNQFEKSLQIQFATDTEISEIGNSNAIYIGPTQTKPVFLHLFNSKNRYLKLKDGKLHLSGYPTINDTILHLKGNRKAREYAIVSKMNGLKQKKAIMLLSNHDMGVNKLIDIFSTNDSIKAFEEKYNILKENFTAIFEMEGMGRTATSSKCLFIIRE